MPTTFFRTKCLVLILLALAMAIGLWSLLPFPQNINYHHFADARTFFGIPNTLNVLSNIPFLIVGIMGLLRVLRWRDEYSLIYGVFFLGVFCVWGGSSYYHWHPDNARLIWDRLPMTVGFYGDFCGHDR